jgi:CBS-domain-containing membrane protein
VSRAASEKPSALERVQARAGDVGVGVYSAVLSVVVLAAVGGIGLASQLPWLFPSLGPTVMLLFESPRQPSSRPVNVLVGHGVGILVGIGCLAAFGLFGQQPAPVGGLTLGYLLSGTVSVAVTTLILTAIRLPHPPAGASTLIVSLGILTAPAELVSMAGAVLFTCALSWGLNILLGTTPLPRGAAEEPA